MRRAGWLSVAAMLWLTAATFAGEDKPGGMAMEGRITKVDAAATVMTVRDAADKETAIYWTDATRIEGGKLEVGAIVHFKAAEKDGKWWASWVHVGELHKM